MRFSLVFLLPAALLAQTPAAAPRFDPNDPDGLVNHSNGRTRFGWKRKGTWTVQRLHNPYGQQPAVPPASAADVRQMTATLSALTALLRTTPEGADPRGYFMKESNTYGYVGTHEVPSGFLAARLPVIFSTGYFPFYIADEKHNGVWVPVTGGETESVYFYFNRLPGRFDRRVIAQEKVGDANPIEFYPRPSTKTRYAGFPVVEGQDLMIVRGGRDPWVAVPHGRVLRAAMAEFAKDKASAEERLARLKATEAETLSPAYEQKMREHLEKYSGTFRTTDPRKWQGRLAGMERELLYNREKASKDANPQRDAAGNWYWHPMDAHADAARRLAAITPAEADRPACFVPAMGEQGRYAIPGRILPMGADPRCEEIVTTNFGYFDTTLPRSAPQILLVRSFGRCAKVVDGKLVGPPPHRDLVVPPQGCQRHALIWEALDWAKVAALLVP